MVAWDGGRAMAVGHYCAAVLPAVEASVSYSPGAIAGKRRGYRLAPLMYAETALHPKNDCFIWGALH